MLLVFVYVGHSVVVESTDSIATMDGMTRSFCRSRFLLDFRDTWPWSTTNESTATAPSDCSFALDGSMFEWQPVETVYPVDKVICFEIPFLMDSRRLSHRVGKRMESIRSKHDAIRFAELTARGSTPFFKRKITSSSRADSLPSIQWSSVLPFSSTDRIEHP